MQIDAGHLCPGKTTARNVQPDHVEMIRRLIAHFGRYAESLFDYHDLGFPREAVRDHISSAEAEIRRIQEMGSEAFLEIPEELLQAEFRDIWNAKKNLRYAAGAVMMSELRKDIRPENRLRAIRLKILYEAYVDTIDDLIDTDGYSFADALDLMRHCLASLTRPGFDRRIFREELSGRLSPAQRRMTDFLTCLGEAVHRSIWASPQGASVVGELDRFQENWALGEAYTMYQKDPTLDVRAFLTAASHMPAPDPDLEPWERIGGWIAHTTALSLLDLCYADAPMSAKALEEHLAAWFYFDSVVTMMNNVMDLQKDVDQGIANIFMIACGRAEVRELRTVRGFRPAPTIQDYEAFLTRTAELARRSLEHAWRSCEDPDLFYPFLTIMAPVVMFVNEAGIREDVIHAYLRTLAPMIRETLAPEPQPVPTIPLGTRSGRNRSARTASS
jgi:hypothetical protein